MNDHRYDIELECADNDSYSTQQDRFLALQSKSFDSFLEYSDFLVLHVEDLHQFVHLRFKHLSKAK